MVSAPPTASEFMALITESAVSDREFFFDLVDWAAGIESDRAGRMAEAAHRSYGSVGAIKAKLVARGCVKFIAMNTIGSWASDGFMYDDECYATIIGLLKPGEA